MARSEARCPKCGEQIGWARKGQQPRVFRPVATITTITADGMRREYVCPACRYHWVWAERRADAA